MADQKTYSIASIPADGIGPEVINAGITALNALTDTLKTFKLEFKNYDWSSETYKRTGKYIPDGGLDELKKHDAIFFGAVGAPGKLTNTPLLRKQDTDSSTRRPRSHLPMGPKTRHLPAIPAVCQRAPNTRIPRHRVPSAQVWTQRP
jgi:isocitrate/isopropylmalate dehydrogenase